MPTIIGLTELFASLHVAKIHGMKAPHKAVLLLSVIDLVESGSIDTPFVYLTNELIQKFNDVWNYYISDPLTSSPTSASPTIICSTSLSGVSSVVTSPTTPSPTTR